MISVLSHDLDIPPLSALQSNDQHAKSLFKFSPPLPYKAMISMLKSLFKSSPPLPYKAMISRLSDYLNLPLLSPTKQ